MAETQYKQVPKIQIPEGYSFVKALTGPGNWDAVTAHFPYNDDPRFANLHNGSNECHTRFIVFCRCVRELGEDDPRCKYQYFRAQTRCMENQLEEWMEHRARGSSMHDFLPDRLNLHMRQ